MQKNIPFSPPDITQAEIDEVIDTLKSGWITTGPKTKEFERQIAAYCGVERAVCLNSATAGLELVLRLLDIGPGDEVITTPYTFAATANVILHVGATPVFADVRAGEFNIDPHEIEKQITSRTKAVIPVDFAGWPCDYDEIHAALQAKKSLYSPKGNSWQTAFDRPALIADAAHSFGAAYKGKKVGSLADFNVFSFHAVKNLTTAEGGAVTLNSLSGIPADDIYRQFMLWSLHGQSKDALAKSKAGSWEYTIELPGYKCNMTDIAASLGLAQLRRYDSELLQNRKRIFDLYMRLLSREARIILPPFQSLDKRNSYHLFPIRIAGADQARRKGLIEVLVEKGVSSNVHFIPLPMHVAYRQLGYGMQSFPNAFTAYEGMISLPIYSTLRDTDVEYICATLLSMV